MRQLFGSLFYGQLKKALKEEDNINYSVLERCKNRLGPMWFILLVILTTLVFLSLARISFMSWQSERVLAANGLANILLNGLRIDISIICYAYLIPTLVLSIWSIFSSIPTALKHIITLWIIAFSCIFVFLEVITPTFILEYDLRPNRLLIEYLQYPQEVFSMLYTGYKLEIIVALLFLILTIKAVSTLVKRHWRANTNNSKTVQSIFVLFFLVLGFLGARSSLGHRPMNPAMVAFSNDHLMNDLTLNSTYSALFAALQMKNEKSSESYYGKMPQDEMINIVRSSTNIPLNSFNNSDKPSLAYHQASYQGKPKNLVILLQESLGARYVGELGGLPLSPNLDKLMQQGWNFTNLYATGTRSVRGIEAVVTGFTPTPSRAVVKLNKSQQNFFTLASFLKQQNYQTQFIYGGESHFDNMKSFFLGNGFIDIVDFPIFNKVDFSGSWGASDEDLYDQAHFEFEKLSQQEKPFFSLVFTSSNHSPYQFPDNKITLFDKDKNTRNNAAKYADYALGTFIEKAKKSAYWNNTIFIVVADHDSRVAGASLVPIEHFKIPGVIFGSGIPAKKDSRLASQIDLAPTLLSLIGASGYTPMLGHDMTQNIPADKQRAMMQYDKNFAYMNNDLITVLQPNREPAAFHQVNGKLVETKANLLQSEKAKAHALFGSYAYKNQWY